MLSGEPFEQHSCHGHDTPADISLASNASQKRAPLEAVVRDGLIRSNRLKASNVGTFEEIFVLKKKARRVKLTGHDYDRRNLYVANDYVILIWKRLESFNVHVKKY